MGKGKVVFQPHNSESILDFPHKLEETKLLQSLQKIKVC